MTKSKVLDLSTLDTTTACNAGAKVELRHPSTNEPLGIYINVLGRDSDVFKEYIRQSINDTLRRSALAKKRGRDVDVPTVETQEAETIDLLTVCTTGWEGIVMKGEALAFNVANVKRVYTEMAWVRNQINEAIGDLENFMKG